MSFFGSGPTVVNLGNNVTTMTVMAGVTADMTALFAVSGNNSPVNTGAGVISSSNGGAVFTAISPITPTLLAANNSTLGLWKATGLVAGDTVTVTTTGNAKTRGTPFYFERDLTPGTFGVRASSVATTVAPSMVCPAGSKVYAFQFSRTTTAGLALSSVVNSNGRALTQRYSLYATADPSINVNLHEFTETGAATGTTTFTDSVASGNGAAIHLIEAAPPALLGNVAVGGAKKIVTTASVVVAGVRKTGADAVVVGGVKKTLT